MNFKMDLKRVKDYCEKLDRHIPINHFRKRCDRSVYIERIGNKLFYNQYFKLTIKEKVYYAYFYPKKWKSSNGEFGKTCGIDYSLGYKDFELDIAFLSAVNCETEDMTVSISDIIGIEKITKEDWLKVYKIFKL